MKDVEMSVLLPIPCHANTLIGLVGLIGYIIDVMHIEWYSIRLTFYTLNYLSILHLALHISRIMDGLVRWTLKNHMKFRQIMRHAQCWCIVQSPFSYHKRYRLITLVLCALRYEDKQFIFRCTWKTLTNTYGMATITVNISNERKNSGQQDSYCRKSGIIRIPLSNL